MMAFEQRKRCDLFDSYLPTIGMDAIALNGTLFGSPGRLLVKVFGGQDEAFPDWPDRSRASRSKILFRL